MRRSTISHVEVGSRGPLALQSFIRRIRPFLHLHSALFRFPVAHALLRTSTAITNTQAFSAPPDQIGRGNLTAGQN